MARARKSDKTASKGGGKGLLFEGEDHQADDDQEELPKDEAGRRKIKVVHALRRTRDTETQTHLASHDKRVDNVRAAFALRRSAAPHIRGRHVIVIDYVKTSGSTLAEVARTLRHAGPASVCAAVLAIADRKGRGFEVI